ncbi:MAG: alpha/beta hydrolase fold domain-containing protein [Henriciella sp.]|nr:alpha/beta hydrolase fold domain-containing protein [Henriciella sp.]
MKRISITIAAALCAACSGGGGSTPAEQPVTISPPPPPPPASAPSLESETDIVYGSGLVENSAVDLLLDIYQPEGECTDPRPFVLGIHGGGFTGGSKSAAPWITNMEAVAGRGLIGLSIDYRLVGDLPLVSAEFQPLLDELLTLADQINLDDRQRDQLNAAVAAFEDTTVALEWARENAEARCLDIDRFAIWGSSAGAITALHVSYALDDFFIDRPDPLVTVDYWGSLFLPGLIDANGPPLYILHGTNDTTQVYEDTAVPLAAEADAAGIPYTFYTIENGPHGFGSVDPSRVHINGNDPTEVTVDFIEAHLTDGTPLYEIQTVERAP